jgi:ADP-dependent phosphofructokinase/glucokinase
MRDMTITRELENGLKITIELTDAEISKVIKEDNIEFARGILENYDLNVDIEHLTDEEISEFYNKFQEKLCNDNGSIEIEAIEYMGWMQD